MVRVLSSWRWLRCTPRLHYFLPRLLYRHPQQRLSRAQALRGFTLAAAHAQFEEHIEGSLLPGKRADFVVLDRDIMDERVPLADVRSARVLATIINGKTAFSAES